MKIYLIGMPLSGKTTIGKKLAENLNLPFIDLDEMITIGSFMFIDEIFEMYGEEFYRNLETNYLKKIMDIKEGVIATGGGIVTEKRNKALMNGKILYLKILISDLESRKEESQEIRPLLKEYSLEELYEKRQKYYEDFADITVESNNNIDETMKKIVQLVK